ncbi:hypothetical protein V8F20_005837 [Naviculisporaceae sp. PSN 640]
MAITLEDANQPVTYEGVPQPDTKAALERIAESVTDGRAENVRYRQEELFSLHASLVEHAPFICQALATVPRTESDERREEAVHEAEVEYYLTLDAVRHFYDSLDFDKELEDEYAVTNGRNYENRRVGYGMVVIRPTRHTRFYSVVVPLAAALSAGNCVVVEVKPRYGVEKFEIDTLLRTLLTKSLDANIFCLVDDITEDFSKSDFNTPFILVLDQRDDVRLDIPGENVLVSANDRITLAVIDRTADVDEAVRLIAQSQTRFGGKSPYAPDWVLVNEFVKDVFVEACSRFPGVEIAFHEGEERRTFLAVLEPQDESRVLHVATCYSLVDVISAVGPGSELLAGYFFAEPRAAKYLSQHLPCDVSYINQIPTHLLIGPAVPRITSQPDLLYRYSREMFSRPRPQLIEPPPEPFRIIDDYLAGDAEEEPLSSQTESEEKLSNRTTERAGPTRKKNRKQELRALATRPLKPVIRPNNADVGFFESALLLAAGLTKKMTPVHLFSHGSTMMLGEESASASYWEKCGREALANGVEHIVMMGAHWATSSPRTVLLSANPSPGKSPVAFVSPPKYKTYPLKPDLSFLPTIQAHLSSNGITSILDPTFDYIHDTYLILIRMFPDPATCPPSTIISANYAYDPHFHVSIGAALRPLRSQNVLFIGSGGSVHNLYRNIWTPMLKYRDNFAQPTPPEPWALDFRQEVIDTFCAGYEEDEHGRLPSQIPYGKEIRCKKDQGVGGPMLRRKATSLMKHPKYRDAHATDDHFMATMFVAGLCGSVEDVGLPGVLGAEDWELTNMCNSQFTLGSW